VDAASADDEIRVAAGTYAGVSARAGVTQTVYISKTVTIRGGYTTANWTRPNPAANPTTLDAQGLGRVVYVTGDIAFTIEGLRITGGDATGLGGGVYWEADAGGGVCVDGAKATISNCAVINNTASTVRQGHGGGLHLNDSDATLSGNTVVSNTASTASDGGGGGLFLLSGAATLSGNTMQGNTASTASDGVGGGLYLLWSDATLSGNTVRGNVASAVNNGYGGGLCLGNSSDTTLSSNTVVSNTAALDADWAGFGGGLYIEDTPFTLTNSLVADNQANTGGSGLWIAGDWWRPITGNLLHTTIADNRSSGQGVFVGNYTTLAFTNTIIAGRHSVGITVTTGGTATLEATLWYNNGSDTGGGGTIVTGAVNVYDDPAFVNPSAWDYHLTDGSAAIDAGVDAGVTTDIDGDVRPWGAGHDIGADEYRVWHIYMPVVLRRQ